MKILTSSALFCREFAGAVLPVPELLKWVASKGLHLRTVPEISEYDMVQVESLLCAIERAAAPNLDDAMDMVAANPRLAGHRAAGDAHTSMWLLGADAHCQWREILVKAVADGELRLLDGFSLLPLPFDAPKPAEKALLSTERNTLLTIIAALCDHAQIQLDRGAAGRIVRMVEKIGARIDEDTVRRALAKIHDAKQTRMT